MDVNEHITKNLVHSIHVSERRSFRGCRRRWSWIFRDLWYPPMTAKPLEFGIAYHKACEHWYDPDFWGNDRDIRKIETLQVFRNECNKQLADYKKKVAAGQVQQFEEDEVIERDYKERIELGQGMLQEMFKTSAELDHDTYTPIGVEVKFEVPIADEDGQTIWCRCNRCWKKWCSYVDNVLEKDTPNWIPLAEQQPEERTVHWKGLPVTFGGRIDMLAQDVYGRYWIFDWKGQSLTSPILTPAGWSTMGAIQVGDKVIGADGKSAEVLGVKDRGTEEVWEVVFTDDTVVECTDDHLWQIHSAQFGWNKVLRTDQLTKSYERYCIDPIGKPVEFNFKQILPMHAYVLGALLGDGSTMNGALQFASQSGETIELLKQYATSDIEFRDWRRPPSGNSWGIIGPWLDQLQVLDLVGKRSAEKFIPQQYLFASVEDRILLLQGLCDTDGSTGLFRFSTTGKQLAEDFRHLVWSLGGTADLSVAKARKHVNGTTDNAEEYFVNYTLPEGIEPNQLERKRVGRPTRTKKTRRRIKEVRRTDRTEPMKCIYVDSPEHLYVTRNFVLTHNTAARLSTGDPGSPDDYLWFDDQITSYAWALWVLGIDVAGFIYHEQKKAMAEEPEPLKRPYKGALYSQNRQKTYDYEVYKTTVSENDPQGFAAGLYDEYIQFLEENNVFYKRHTIHRNEEELKAAGIQIAWEAEEITNSNLRIYKSAGRYSCGFCAFKEPCLAKDRGEDYLYTLESLFEKRQKLYYETAESNTDKSQRG